jgi:23S rRNA pseudouridine1911/1915/1917 synthase
VISIDVTDAGRGARLDRFLAATSAVGSRASAERLLRSGVVTVNGEQRHKAFRLQPGMVIAIDAAAPADQPLTEDRSVPFTIAYEDDQLIIVDKPAGVVVHPAAGADRRTLVHGLVSHRISGGDDTQRPGIIHRLDRDTSGLLVIAKTDEAWRVLSRAMRRRTIRREYLALVHGCPSARAGRIEAPIGRDRGKGRMSISGSAARDAITHFVVEQRFARTSLLRLRLETGRTHQIRVHLQAIGHPVVADPAYGGADLPDYGLDRQFLHACRLVLDHPVTGAQIDAQSPLPPDLAAALLLASGE